MTAELEQAWKRGDWRPEGLGPLVEALARSAPAEAPRWLARWTTSPAFDEVSRRARVLARLKDDAGAAQSIVDARGRTAWTLADEVKAFDLWRGVAKKTEPTAPAPWTAARVFWTKKAGEVGADLAVHLRAHPYDLLGARAALPAPPPPAIPKPWRSRPKSSASLPRKSLGNNWSDQALLRLRAARGRLASSARAAATALGTVDPGNLLRELRRRRMSVADMEGALEDLARLAARTGRPSEPAMAVLEDVSRDHAARLRIALREIEKPAPAPASIASKGAGPSRIGRGTSTGQRSRPRSPREESDDDARNGLRPGTGPPRLRRACPGRRGRPPVAARSRPGGDIRRRVADGRPIRYLVPDAVADAIAQHNLYRTAAGRPAA